MAHHAEVERPMEPINRIIAMIARTFWSAALIRVTAKVFPLNARSCNETMARYIRETRASTSVT